VKSLVTKCSSWREPKCTHGARILRGYEGCQSKKSRYNSALYIFDNKLSAIPRCAKAYHGIGELRNGFIITDTHIHTLSFTTVMAELLGFASAITSLITFAGTIWSAVDDLKSADRNIRDQQTEIDFLLTEFDAINNLLGTSRLNDFPLEYRAGAQEVEAGLVRFKSALDRVDRIVGKVTRSSQGSSGKFLGFCQMRLEGRELRRLKAHIGSIRTHLQAILNTRQGYI